jgi:hypothetical protein
VCERSQDPDLKTFASCGRRSSTMSSLYPVPRGGAADALPNQRLLETGVSPVHGCKRTGHSTRFLAGPTPGARSQFITAGGGQERRLSRTYARVLDYQPKQACGWAGCGLPQWLREWLCRAHRLRNLGLVAMRW